MSHPRAFGDDQPHDIAGAGARRDANAELLLAHQHAESDQALEADRCEDCPFV
jgi:hypothetical protein